MMDPDGLDLSPLDPARDQLRWARVVGATRARVHAALSGRLPTPGVLDVVGNWFRPLVAAAAVLAAVLGAAGSAVSSRHAALGRASEARRLALLTDNSLARGQRPTGTELLIAIRSRSAR